MEDLIVVDYKWKAMGPINKEKKKFKRNIAKVGADYKAEFCNSTASDLFFGIYQRQLSGKKGKPQITKIDTIRYFGILLYMGAHHDIKNPISELWNEKHGKTNIYGKAMPRNVFQLINANIETYDVTTFPDELRKRENPENKEETEEEDYLSCDEWVKKHPVDLTEEKLKRDVEVRQKVNDEETIEKWLIKASNTPNSNDKFGKIREVLEAFIHNLVNNKYFTPSTTLSVDEHLCAFKGKIWAKVFIKSKPQRYGIKFCFFFRRFTVLRHIHR
ncbi:hypothetical protein EIN_463280 [Entamoeba invadens IP1]|uniref:PiggyBac transposable element-derived protein domain-containing protein n=1 Tax=Entamoeba invadens IP1 TaxID=370355 RepID=L7FLK2_ENTIV|nr:hypothetical protein EIN_463280 [Entamoeba invadens IP1]ELP87055.1 hypothetical protein EIN_463280 [Entamoeba invadens IP1]|eukprot:XP_004253826.1 hypothetical protein EIN_463280 [Entamoeba invadens IP1]